MSKKHFIQLAAAIRYARQELNEGRNRAQTVLDNLTKDIAVVCQQSNSNFDQTRFFSACNFKGGA